MTYLGQQNMDGKAMLLLQKSGESQLMVFHVSLPSVTRQHPQEGPCINREWNRAVVDP